MKIISEARFVEEVHYEMFYQWKDSSTYHGMAFACDKDGNIDMAVLEKKPAALDNYNKCINKIHDVKAPQLMTFRHSYKEPRIGRCDCGCEVILDRFTNTCDGCNRDYNMSGQLLAHRSQWGEETGESYCDIMDL
jgi:hypothetical protein